MSETMIPHSEWKWYGNAGHLCVGRWCRFHLATEIGDYLVSTVGEYVHPTKSKASEYEESLFLAEHPLGEEIGCGRLFETMVFRVDGHCVAEGCNCGMPKVAGFELASSGYNTRKDATEGHMKLCIEIAKGNPCL